MKALQLLQLVPMVGREVQVEGCNVRLCACKAAPDVAVCYETTPRVPGGNDGYISCITQMSVIFTGKFIIFDKSVHTDNPRFHVLRNVQQLNVLFPQVAPLTADQVMGLQRLFIDDRRAHRRANRRDRNQEAEIAYADRFVEAMRERRLLPPPDADLFLPDTIQFMRVIQDEEEEEDADLLRAQEESLRTFDREREARGEDPDPSTRPQRKRRIDEAWEAKLRDAEPIVEGAPVCIACKDHKATIVFVPCEHQVMCDTCFRSMWSIMGIDRVCPGCRTPVDTIMRPFSM